MAHQSSQVIVFITGPDSNVGVWSPLLEKMDANSMAISAAKYLVFQVSSIEEDLFQYRKELTIWWENHRVHFDTASVTLVGYSLGCTILLAFFIQQLEAGRAHTFYYLHQIILLADPMVIRKKKPMLTWLLPIKSKTVFEQYRESWSSEIAQLWQKALVNVIDATTFSRRSRPLPVQFFNPLRENVSGMEHKVYKDCNVYLIDCEHQNLIKVLSEEDYFSQWMYAVHNPPAHKAIFLVDELQTLIKVEPVSIGQVEIKVAGDTQVVQTNNQGWVNRSLSFSEKNICNQQFTIRYGIENLEGYITANTKGAENEASSFQMADYREKRKEFSFVFTPKTGGQNYYHLDVELQKGFESGYRDAHFHLGGGKVRYDRIVYKLDLSTYLTTGFSIKSPILMIHPEDSHSCEERFEERKHSQAIPLESYKNGVWEWVLYNIAGGVVDIFWDIA